MNVFAQDLYQQSSSPNSSTARSSNSEYLDFFANIDIDWILGRMNFVALAWTIFYSIVFFINFRFWRIKNGGGELANEKKGVESIVQAGNLWWSYLFALSFFTIYLTLRNTPFNVILGFASFMFYILKFWKDLIAILAILDHFDGSKSIAEKMIKILKLENIQKPKAKSKK